MKKRIFPNVFLAVMLLFSAAACGEVGSASSVYPDSADSSGGGEGHRHFSNAPETAKELLFDTNFEYGFDIFGLNNYHTVLPWAKLLTSDNDALDPAWRIAQWANYVNYFLEKDKTVTETGGEVRYAANWTEPEEKDGWLTISNLTSTVSVNPDTGSFSLFCDSSREYGVTPSYAQAPKMHNPRQAFEDWPHLLLEQYIPAGTSLGDWEAVWFDIAFTVKKAENLTPNYNPGLHTAQFSWIFTMTCDNRSKPSHGKGYWFTLPLYDYRYKVIKASFMEDGGKESATGDMMYGLSNEVAVPGGIEAGRHYTVSVDLYPHLLASFERMRQEGYYADCTLSDMRISTTNIGWELPGTFDAGVEVDYLSVKYVEKG